ncbi:hypothetical protein EXIGLDRAFT_716782 [Exidia glandulosa HHB12029]|uniref:Uncharacterized protein n=1 Tax=Exidia glandulosa HHB12029 TaxID=1314781 RepID=A0A166MUC9_EXIGL|nr:hypothetical protein EXIGLDRAFT_716782 [Exidia glandulosa HHB12029]
MGSFLWGRFLALLLTVSSPTPDSPTPDSPLFPYHPAPLGPLHHPLLLPFPLSAPFRPKLLPSRQPQLSPMP